MAAVLAFLNRPETVVWLLSGAACLAGLIGDAETHALAVRLPPTRPPLPSVEVPWSKTLAVDTVHEPARCEALHRTFENWLQARPDLAELTHWHEVEGLIDAVVLEFARRADGTILERAGREADIPQRVTIRQTVLESGRPVLIMPRKPCTVFGRRIAILWQEDRHVAKAVQAAAPWLASAKAVDVIVGVRTTHAAAARLPPTMEEQGIPAQLQVLLTSRRSFVDAVLAEVRALGSDLVIMGAFGHGPLSSMIRESLTDRVLARLDRPVFLCH